MTKPKVCILVDWFLPGFRAGGPIQSVANLVRALHKYVDFSIVTTNEDFGTDQPYRDVWHDTWQEWEDIAQIYYFSKERLTQKRLQYVINQTQPDYVHLNSMFSVPFTVWPLKMLRTGKLKAKMIVAPRGMLHPGALSLKKAKKKAFLTTAKLTGIAKKVTFQATDTEEVKDIQQVFGESTKIIQAPNIPSLDQMEWKETPKNPAQGLKMVFISRIARKKNIHYLLERLKGFEAFLLLDLYGPVEEESYQAELEQQIADLPENIAVNLKGPVPREKVPETLADYHVFVMPTLGENFGHAIFEALAAGKPVLISDQTPWRKLEAKKAGFDLPLDQPEAFEAALRTFLEMDQKTYNTWSRAAQRMARDFAEDEDLIVQQLALYGLET